MLYRLIVLWNHPEISSGKAFQLLGEVELNVGNFVDIYDQFSKTQTDSGFLRSYIILYGEHWTPEIEPPITRHT
jgi:hypothetical protein